MPKIEWHRDGVLLQVSARLGTQALPSAPQAPAPKPMDSLPAAEACWA